MAPHCFSPPRSARVGVTPHMRSDVPYDSIKDFAPVTNVVLNTTLIVVRAESPLKTMKDLVAAAKPSRVK